MNLERTSLIKHRMFAAFYISWKLLRERKCILQCLEDVHLVTGKAEIDARDGDSGRERIKFNVSDCRIGQACIMSTGRGMCPLIEMKDGHEVGT